MAKMKFLDWIAIVLLVVGGLNWGLIGLIKFDLVAYVFGSLTFFSRLIYSLVGLAGLYSIIKGLINLAK